MRALPWNSAHITEVVSKFQSMHVVLEPIILSRHRKNYLTAKISFLFSLMRARKVYVVLLETLLLMYLLLYLFGSTLWGQVMEFPVISLPLLLLVGLAIGAVVFSIYMVYRSISTRFELNRYVAMKIDVKYRECFRDFYKALGRATTDAETKEAFENFTRCLRADANRK